MTQDHRLQELVAEFQRRTYDAYTEGGMPSASFLVKYATNDITMSAVWSVPEYPAGGGSGNQDEPKPFIHQHETPITPLT